MQLEDLNIALRPRRPWEAIDLGVSMVQRWRAAVFAAWFAVSLPCFLLINLIVADPFWSVALMWWLKPLFDRPLLFVLSRAVFGATPTLRETLRAAPQWLWRSGLIWHLTLGRLDFARSFRLPVMQLEGSRGKQRRERVRVMSARGGGYGAGITAIYIHLEAFFYVGLFGLAYLLLPQSLEINPFELLLEDDSDYAIAWNALAYLATSVIEPFYVASGFGLYLNRRTILEAWDLELNLRRIATRLAHHTGSLATVVVCALMFTLLAPTPVAAALEDSPLGTYRADADAQATIEKVLEDPVFGTEQTVSYWRPKDSDEEEDEPPEPDGAQWEFLKNLGATFSIIAEGLAWGAAAAVAIGVIVYFVRNAAPLRSWFEGLRITRQGRAMPTSVSGLDIAPESLPTDIVAAARAAWQVQDPRAALSLLYRGAIVALLARGLELPDSATEGDVMQRARTLLPDEAAQVLGNLINAWLRLAYGHRAPQDDDFERLCEAYGNHLGHSDAASKVRA